MGKWCFFFLIFDRIIIKVAGNQDRHKSSDELDFGPLVSMAHLYVFWNAIWPWHIGLSRAIVDLLATCFSYSITSLFLYLQFVTLTFFYSWAGEFESYLVENPEDRFLIIWTPFWFISVFELTAYLKFAKLQHISSGFRCRLITGSLMRLY